jgi:hypothetical protein
MNRHINSNENINENQISESPKPTERSSISKWIHSFISLIIFVIFCYVAYKYTFIKALLVVIGLSISEYLLMQLF